MKSKAIKEPNMLAHIVVMLTTLLLCVLFANTSYKIVRNYKDSKGTETNYVMEYATIVRYEREFYYSSEYFNTFYEYVAPDNEVYTGMWDIQLKDEEKAKAQIGKKVPIYVDHELHKHVKSVVEPELGGGPWFCGAVSVICFIIMMYSLMTILRWQFCKNK